MEREGGGREIQIKEEREREGGEREIHKKGRKIEREREIDRNKERE